MHRESKKGDTIFLSISLLNIDRFSQFFHRHTQLEIWNKTINKDPTSPQMCYYTTLWNINVRKSSDVVPVIDGFSRSVKAVMHSLATTVRCFWVNSCYMPYGRCLATSSCYKLQQDSAPVHTARETIKLLQQEMPAFISPDLWPPNSPDLNAVDTKFGEWCKIGSNRKKWRTWTSWEIDWLRSGPDCNITWLMMPSTSGADTYVPAYKLQEDILSICCDCILATYRIWFVKFVENLLIYR